MKLNKMFERFTIIREPQPKLQITTSIGFVSPQNSPEKIIIVKNARGWDIPGGHPHQGENPFQTFAREFQEETGFTLLSGAKQIATIQSLRNPTTGIAVFNGTFNQDEERKPQDSLAYRIVDTDTFLGLYYGDTKLVKELIAIRFNLL